MRLRGRLLSRFLALAGLARPFLGRDFWTFSFSPIALASLAPRDSSPLTRGSGKMLPVSGPFGVRPLQAPGSYG